MSEGSSVYDLIESWSDYFTPCPVIPCRRYGIYDVWEQGFVRLWLHCAWHAPEQLSKRGL